MWHEMYIWHEKEERAYYDDFQSISTKLSDLSESRKKELSKVIVMMCSALAVQIPSTLSVNRLNVVLELHPELNCERFRHPFKVGDRFETNEQVSKVMDTYIKPYGSTGQFKYFDLNYIRKSLTPTTEQVPYGETFVHKARETTCKQEGCPFEATTELVKVNDDPEQSYISVTKANFEHNHPAPNVNWLVDCTLDEQLEELKFLVDDTNGREVTKMLNDLLDQEEGEGEIVVIYYRWF